MDLAFMPFLLPEKRSGDAVGRQRWNIIFGKRLYDSIAYGFEAGFLRSQISQQVAKHPFAEAMDATVQRPQLRNLG